MNILIVDDHPLFRRGLCAYFDQDDYYTVVAQAGNGVEVIKCLKALQVDIVLLDVNLPDYDGFELLSIIRHEYPSIQVVILTMHDEPAYARRAFDLGASAYMVKDDAEELLSNCLEALKRSDYFCSLDDIDHLCDSSSKIKQLSPAELNIFNLVSSAKTSNEIAALLSVSVRTVDNHRSNIAKKLSLRGSNALLKYAIQYNNSK